MYMYVSINVCTVVEHKRSEETLSVQYGSPI